MLESSRCNSGLLQDAAVHCSYTAYSKLGLSGPSSLPSLPAVAKEMSQTTPSVSGAVSIFETWLREGPFQDQRKVDSLPPAELDTYLAGFFSTVKKKDGRDYSVSSLGALRTRIKQYLQRSGYPRSITDPLHFPISLEAFQERRQALSSLSQPSAQGYRI